MQTCNIRASGITAETGSFVRDGAIRVKAVGSGHAEAVLGVVVALHSVGGITIEFQTVAAAGGDEASCWVVV